MSYLFSNANRFKTWRILWTNLAIAEKELGVKNISDEAIAQMKANWVSVSSCEMTFFSVPPLWRCMNGLCLDKSDT